MLEYGGTRNFMLGILLGKLAGFQVRFPGSKITENNRIVDILKMQN